MSFGERRWMSKEMDIRFTKMQLLEPLFELVKKSVDFCKFLCQFPLPMKRDPWISDCRWGILYEIKERLKFFLGVFVYDF